MESRLFQALKAFKGAEGCEANLFEEFKKIAEAAFFSGYIKDKIKYLKGKDEFGYALGAVCPNPSGVDVLFDDPQKKYHASFLIRGYKAIEPGKKEWENNEKRKDWAPHDFWYDFFGGANMLNNGKFSIEWIDDTDEKSGYAEPMPRINIEDNRLWGFKKVEKL